MASHRKPKEPKKRVGPGKRSRLIPLGVVLGLGAAAFGGFAIAGSSDSHTTLTTNLAETSVSTHHSGVTFYACRSGGKLTHVSVNKAPKCPAHSVLVHWTGHSAPTSSAKPQPQPTHTSDPPASSAPASPTKCTIDHGAHCTDQFTIECSAQHVLGRAVEPGHERYWCSVRDEFRPWPVRPLQVFGDYRQQWLKYLRSEQHVGGQIGHHPDPDGDEPRQLERAGQRLATWVDRGPDLPGHAGDLHPGE